MLKPGTLCTLRYDRNTIVVVLKPHMLWHGSYDCYYLVAGPNSMIKGSKKINYCYEANLEIL